MSRTLSLAAYLSTEETASTLVVSQGVDLGIPVERLDAVKRRLRSVDGLTPSRDEPSVYVPGSPNLIGANFLGLDARVCETRDTYVLEDAELPLRVFGALGLGAAWARDRGRRTPDPPDRSAAFRRSDPLRAAEGHPRSARRRRPAWPPRDPTTWPSSSHAC